MTLKAPKNLLPLPNMKTRVSIIEDDERLRSLFAGWLGKADGLRLVGEFGDAETALESLPQQAPDVVLVDINLPGMDGVECVRRLKPMMPETQFMMVTVYEDAKRIVDALAAGASGYLLKRAKREELLEAIIEVRNGGSPMTSSIARKLVQTFQQAPAVPPSDSIQLAPREQQVLDLIVQGYVTKEIADLLQISIATIKTYIRRIYEKLHAHSRGEAVAKYLGR
jgi:DNA-binding NarL/FixJ family response regulator